MLLVNRERDPLREPPLLLAVESDGLSMACRVLPTDSKVRPGRSVPSARLGNSSVSMTMPCTGVRPVPLPLLSSTRARLPSAIRTQVRTGFMGASSLRGIGLRQPQLYDNVQRRSAPIVRSRGRRACQPGACCDPARMPASRVSASIAITVALSRILGVNRPPASAALTIVEGQQPLPIESRPLLRQSVVSIGRSVPLRGALPDASSRAPTGPYSGLSRLGVGSCPWGREEAPAVKFQRWMQPLTAVAGAGRWASLSPGRVSQRNAGAPFE